MHWFDDWALTLAVLIPLVGLAAVLAFVGVKMLLTDVFHVPVWASLLTISVTIGISVVASLRHAPVAG